MAATNSGPRKPYTRLEIDRVLAEVAVDRGNVRNAIQRLKRMVEDGHLERVPTRKTIEKWMVDYRVEYAKLASDVAPKVRQAIAQESVELVSRYAKLEHRILDKIEKQLDKAGDEDGEDIPIKDLVAMQRNMTVGRGISTDKYRDVTGEKLVPQGENRSPEEIFAQLAKRFPNAVLVVPTGEGLPAGDESPSPAGQERPALPSAEPVEHAEN